MNVRMKPFGSASARASPRIRRASSFSPFAMVGECLENDGPQPLILSALFFHLPAERFQHRQRRGGVSPGQVHTGLAERKSVCLGELPGRRQVALADEDQHPRGGDQGCLLREAVPTHLLIGLRQESGRFGHVSLGQLQAGQYQFAGHGICPSSPCVAPAGRSAASDEEPHPDRSIRS